MAGFNTAQFENIEISGGITLKYVYVSLAPKEFTAEGQAGTGDTFAGNPPETE